MDLLSSVLRELRFESAAYRWLELGRTFRLVFDRPELRGVHIVVRGGCEVTVGDGTAERLTPGDLVMLPSGDDHVLRSLPDPHEDTVVVCGAFLIGAAGHPVLRGLPRMVAVRGTGGRPQPWLAPLVEALMGEARDGGAGSDLVMARMSDALVVRTLRHHSAAAHRGWLAGLGDPYLAPVLAAMHADPARPWTLTRLAAVAGLSRTAFAARFTERIGEPAMHYLTALRMQRAKDLLRDERATVTAVAARVGYRSDVGFAAAFKREVGVPPGSYRSAQAP